MSDRKLCWKKVGHYTVFIVASIHEDGFVSIPDPYRKLLMEYLSVAGESPPDENDDAEWFDGIADLPAEYD